MPTNEPSRPKKAKKIAKSHGSKPENRNWNVEEEEVASKSAEVVAVTTGISSFISRRRGDVTRAPPIPNRPARIPARRHRREETKESVGVKEGSPEEKKRRRKEEEKKEGKKESNKERKKGKKGKKERKNKRNKRKKGGKERK